MDKYLEIKNQFEAKEDKENAKQMAKYMKNKFEFYGIQTPERKAVYNDLLKNEKKNRVIDWTFLEKCFEDEHREFQYLVSDYLITMKKYANYEDICKIKKFIVTKSWWDTIDALCKVIGDISLRDARVKELMKEWSKSDNIWIRRTAIEHQLCLKDKTDCKILEEVILNSLGTNEFFINKAIGWALRDYSKTNPKWVKAFILTNKEKLSHLSIVEGSKYIYLEEKN